MTERLTFSHFIWNQVLMHCFTPLYMYIYLFSCSFMVVLGLSCGMHSPDCRAWASLELWCVDLVVVVCRLSSRGVRA